MRIKEIKKLVQYNKKVYGEPKLIDKNNLPDHFIYNNDMKSVYKEIVRYFLEEPEKWHLPAKNYFVRICLAWYLRDKVNDADFWSLLNTNDILPYDDSFSPTLDRDKDGIYIKIYDEVIYNHNVYQMPGYIKTMEVFEYLYKPIVKEKQLTIGYNGTGQDFFDIVSFKKKYIEEYFFSLTHSMRKNKLDKKEILNGLAKSNTYGLPGNLLLNTDDEEAKYKELISEVDSVINIQSVSVLHYDLAKKIKDAFPELKIHISTHGSEELKIEDINPEIIYCVNINEPHICTDQQHDVWHRCKELGIKTKHIVNRGCVNGKWEVMSALAGRDIMCCNNFQCMQLSNEIPWLNFTRINLQKEFLRYYKPDFLKISTRDVSNDTMKVLLDYWTSLDISKKIYDIELNENNFSTYLEWIKYRCTNCNGSCHECYKCKQFYELLKREDN